MKKLKINEEYLIKCVKEECKETNPEIYEEEKDNESFWHCNLGEYKIDIINYKICRTNEFRYKLHQIVKYFFKNDEKLQNEISNKNFTTLILAGVIDVIEEEF